MIRKATAADIDAVAMIYEHIHAKPNSTGWLKDIYPVRATAEAAVQRGDLFVYEDDGRILASAVLNRNQCAEYVEGHWECAAEDSEVMVMHTLTVEPEHSSCGIGRSMVSFYEEYARKQGCKALRMDTNEKNLPARALYKRLGYREVGIVPTTFNGIPDVMLVLLEKPLCPLLIRQARSEEFDRVRDFYFKLIDDMQNCEYHPKWQKGVYPEEKNLKAAIECGELYIGLLDNEILSAMIVNHSCTDGYEAAAWPSDATGDEVAVIHTLGVMPAYSGLGLAKQMVHEAMDMAKRGGSKVVRLDVLEGNLPAEKLYKRIGFKFVERVQLFYEDTGLCNFDLYEYRL